MIVGKLLEGPGGNYGYNAATNEYGDLVKQGIIDPLKVRRNRQSSAISQACTLKIVALYLHRLCFNTDGIISEVLYVNWAVIASSTLPQTSS